MAGAVCAQQPLPVIGYLNSTSPSTYAIYTDAFREGLQSTGYVEGVTVAIEYRWADGRNDRLPALAAELASQQVAVIVATGATASAVAAKAATRTIPIVFISGGDPVQFNWSTASIDQEETSLVLAFWQTGWFQSNWIYCSS